MRKTILASVIALAMGMGGAGAATQFGGVTDALKDVGHATKSTVKKAGEGTKKAVGTTGKAVEKGATKTKRAVTGVKCADGTHQSSKAGCAHRGGVVK